MCSDHFPTHLAYIHNICVSIQHDDNNPLQRGKYFGIENAAEARSCVQSFEQQGVDLSQYRTAVIAQDFKVHREALEIVRWNVYSSSYGSKPGLLYPDLDLDGVRSVIIDSGTDVFSPAAAALWNHGSSKQPVGYTSLSACCSPKPASQCADFAYQPFLEILTVEPHPKEYKDRITESVGVVHIAIEVQQIHNTQLK